MISALSLSGTPCVRPTYTLSSELQGHTEAQKRIFWTMALAIRRRPLAWTFALTVHSPLLADLLQRIRYQSVLGSRIKACTLLGMFLINPTRLDSSHISFYILTRPSVSFRDVALLQPDSPYCQLPEHISIFLPRRSSARSSCSVFVPHSESTTCSSVHLPADWQVEKSDRSSSSHSCSCIG